MYKHFSVLCYSRCCAEKLFQVAGVKFQYRKENTIKDTQKWLFQSYWSWFKPSENHRLTYTGAIRCNSLSHIWVATKNAKCCSRMYFHATSVDKLFNSSVIGFPFSRKVNLQSPIWLHRRGRNVWFTFRSSIVHLVASRFANRRFWVFVRMKCM